jgi:hypothetical protein
MISKYYGIVDAYDDYKREAKAYNINKAPIISREVYREIVTTFIKVMIQFMLSGFVVHLPMRNGSFRLLYNKRKLSKKSGFVNLVPNWGASNKKKKEILDRGGLLYEEWWERDGNKYNEPLIGSVKKTNGGEQWIIYYTDEGYYKFYWIRYMLGLTVPKKDATQEEIDKLEVKLTKRKLWHLLGYTFKPVRSLARSVKDIQDLPSYKFLPNENNISEVNIERSIQRFRDTRRELD